MERAGTPQSARPGELRNGHLQVVPADPEDRGRSDSWIPLTFALAVGAVAVVAWLSTALPARGPLARVPAAERAAVVERAVENLRDVCRAADRPRDFCVEQARLLAGAPECGAGCQALVRDELQADTAVR